MDLGETRLLGFPTHPECGHLRSKKSFVCGCSLAVLIFGIAKGSFSTSSSVSALGFCFVVTSIAS